MTLLMVWTNKPDDPTSINIASDSLLSAHDGKGGQLEWRYATKIHRLHPTREYFAYCGGSFMALSAVSSALATISNSDHLYKVEGKEAPTIGARVKAIREHLHHTLPLIPPAWSPSATLLLAGWDPRKERFALWVMELTNKEVSKPTGIDLTSKRVHYFGSGATNAKTRVDALAKSASISTEGIVRVLGDVIDDTAEPTVGGAPQMVMLRRDDDVPVGFWWPGTGDKDERHLFGLPIRFSSKMENVKWVTRTFEDRPFTPFKRVENP